MYTARYATKDVSPVSPTLDDVADALKTGKIFASEPIKDALRAVCRSKTIELFNFGPLELDVVREAQHEAVEFVMHEHFTTPYDACIYRSSIEYDNAKVGTLLVVVTGGVKLGVSPCHSGIAVVRVVKAIDTIFAMHCICTHKTQLTRDGRAIQMEIRQHELDFWRGHLPDEEETQWQLTEGALCMLGMTMILNTKGVLKERSAPPVKPNKVREKQGRPPLLYTTRVYTNVYNQSVAPGTGTHASPRPHRRRAHVRHYPATATREGYSLPIAAMLVNWDGRPLEARAEYKVK
jgi:hypothetical protein